MIAVQVDLAGMLVEFRGTATPISQAAAAAAVAHGALLDDGTRLADVLVLSLPLLPQPQFDTTELLAAAASVGNSMVARGHGRMLVLMSVLGAVPMRRHPEFSAATSAAMSAVRSLAMHLGPKVLVNGIGIGAVGEPLVAGDLAMVSHTALNRVGLVDEVIDTALFFLDPPNTYTTGQVLMVDGGWSAGYGRNF